MSSMDRQNWTYNRQNCNDSVNSFRKQILWSRFIYSSRIWMLGLLILNLSLPSNENFLIYVTYVIQVAKENFVLKIVCIGLMVCVQGIQKYSNILQSISNNFSKCKLISLHNIYKEINICYSDIQQHVFFKKKMYILLIFMNRIIQKMPWLKINFQMWYVFFLLCHILHFVMHIVDIQIDI